MGGCGGLDDRRSVLADRHYIGVCAALVAVATGEGQGLLGSQEGSNGAKPPATLGLSLGPSLVACQQARPIGFVLGLCKAARQHPGLPG